MYQNYVFDFSKISQSWFHMMMFYYALRIDIAVGVLRESHRDRWPQYWYRNMLMDMVRRDIETFTQPADDTRTLGNGGMAALGILSSADCATSGP